MPTNIEIQPATAEKLFSIAEKRGVSIDTLLAQILKPFNKSAETSDKWQLAGSIELLDEDLKTARREINRMLQKSILETARNL